MAKSIDLWSSKRPVDATHITKSVNVHGRKHKAAYDFKSTVYRSSSWFKLRLVMLKQWSICLYCGVNKATILDHHTPLLVDQSLSHTPSNLVPCCSQCHSSVIRPYDVPDKYGDKKQGKPDPRDAAFYHTIEAMTKAGLFDKPMDQLRKERAKSKASIKPGDWVGC